MSWLYKKIFLFLFLWIFIVSCNSNNLETNENLWNDDLVITKTNTVDDNKIDIIEEDIKISNNENDFIENEKNLNNNKKEMNIYKEWDIVAVIKTTNGTINILLETEKVPITTTNFIWLAKKWYYDWVIFHRIIKWFMIQWGDPDGTGRWWVSIYWEKFEDEFHPDLKNEPYTISMANAWPNTNGSQFFINTVNNTHLNNRHSVFWKVVEWLENVDKIEKTKIVGWDRPEKEIKMIKVEIKEYKWGSLKDYEFNLDSVLKKNEEKKKVELEVKKDKVLEVWDTVSVHYTLTLEDGTKKDSSLDRGEPFTFTLWKKMVIKWWDEWLLGHKIGDKFKLEVSPEDGYGLPEMKVPKSELQSFIDAGVKLEKWEVLPTGQWEIPIIDADEDSITIENKNELAWKKLFFDIEVIYIK